MNWWKIVIFGLSALIAIGGLYLTKPERPGLAKILIFLIIITTIIGIILEIKDTQEHKLEQFKAEKAYAKIDEQHSVIMEKDEKIAALEEHQRKLKQEVEGVNKKAEPNKISFLSKEIEKTDSVYKATLRFQPSKNEPLGQLVFIARLPKESNAKIIDFWPTLGGGAFQSGKDSKKISEDGQVARLIYSLMGPGYPTIELTVSEPTSILIEGNNDLEKFLIKIE